MKRFSCVVVSGNCPLLSTWECTEFLTNCIGCYIIRFSALQVVFLLKLWCLILAKVDHWDSEGHPLLFPLQKQSRVCAYGSHKRKMIKITHTKRTIKFQMRLLLHVIPTILECLSASKLLTDRQTYTSNMVNIVGLSFTLSYVFYVKSIGHSMFSVAGNGCVLHFYFGICGLTSKELQNFFGCMQDINCFNFKEAPVVIVYHIIFNLS